MAVYPERMRALDPADVQDAIVTIEKYIEYMRQRGEFAFERVNNITAELDEIERTLDAQQASIDNLAARVRALESR